MPIVRLYYVRLAWAVRPSCGVGSAASREILHDLRNGISVATYGFQCYIEPVQMTVGSTRAPIVSLLALLCAGACWSAQKPRVVVVAIDTSGSMRQSDPTRLRVQAAGLLLSAAGPEDQVGVVLFGDNPRWLQAPVPRPQFNPELLQRCGESDAHTDFASLLTFWKDQLQKHDSDWREAFEPHLVILTDGKADPGTGTASGNAQQAQATAESVRTITRISTIGLGKSVDSEFLSSLVRTTHGYTAVANSSTDLTNSFLQIATRVYSVPVYDRLAAPDDWNWHQGATRAVAFLFGKNPAVRGVGTHVLYSGPDLAVIEADPSSLHAFVAWTGSGQGYLCIQEPLRLSTSNALPKVLLTDTSTPVSLELRSNDRLVTDAWFLKQASADLLLQSPSSRRVAALGSTKPGIYSGSLPSDTPGKFAVTARLTGPYGSVETSEGETVVSLTAVSVPTQLRIAVFDPVPRSWLATHIPVSYLLASGQAEVRLEPGPGLSVSPQVFTVRPGDQRVVNVSAASSAKSGQDLGLKYEVAWTNSVAKTTRAAEIEAYIQPLTIAEAARTYWAYFAGLGLLVAVVVFWTYAYLPRPIRCSLELFRSGQRMRRIELPRDLKARELRIVESSSPDSNAKDVLAVAGKVDRELAVIRSQRRKGRWTAVLMPRVQLTGRTGITRGEVDLKEIARPSFKTDDGIEIRFY